MRIHANLPAFLFAVFLVYFAVPIAALVGRLPFWDFRSKRSDVYGWAKLIVKGLFRVKAVKVGGEELCRDRCVYLANHRSWGDFFLDVYLTEGRAVFLSRMAVFFVFPIFVMTTVVLRWVILFRRVAIKDHEKFNKWLDSKMAITTASSVLVFPEGHRSTKPHSLPLRRGMLKYAHSRKLPVQAVITQGKELVLAEKKWSAHWNQTIGVGYSPVISPARYPDFDEFVGAVQMAWDRKWREVFSADLSSLPALYEQGHEADYPLDVRLKQAVWVPTSIFIFAAFLWALYYGLRALSACIPPSARTLVVTVAAATWVLLIAQAFVPVPLKPSVVPLDGEPSAPATEAPTQEKVLSSQSKIPAEGSPA